MKKAAQKAASAVCLVFALFGVLATGGAKEAWGFAGIMCLFALPTLFEDRIDAVIEARKKAAGAKAASAPKPEPVPQPAPKPEPVPSPKPVSEPVQKSEPATVSVTQPAPKSVPKPVPQPAPKSVPKPVPKAKSKATVLPRLQVYWNAHRDQMDIVCTEKGFVASALNDGYPNPGAACGGDEAIPLALVLDYSHERFAQWARRNFWFKEITAGDMKVSESEVRRFLAQADPALWKKLKRKEEYYDFYYNYLYADGGIIVYHRIQDRMSSDPPEEYFYTREQLGRICREDFIEWFGNRWNDEAKRRGLDEWLRDLGVTFSTDGSPTPWELEPWNLGKEPPKAVSKPAPKAAPKPDIDLESLIELSRDRVNDMEDIFQLDKVHIDGEWRNEHGEIWCDARGMSREQILQRLSTRSARQSYTWHIVIEPLMLKQIRELDAEASRKWPKWTLRWLVRQGPAPEGALQLWFAPLEKKRYCTRAEWVGYSHDGSEDYYALVTQPVD